MSSQIFKHNSQPIPDDWTFLEEDQPLSCSESPVMFSLARWLTARNQNLEYNGTIGVRLENTDSIESLIPDLQLFQLICIDFPDAVDGRGYTLANLLRNRHGYQNELRATGEVLVDQLFLLKRCGFDSFELKPGQQINGTSNYFKPFSVEYQ